MKGQFNILCFSVPYSMLFRLSPGIEPCSSHSQCDALPNKLKTTFIHVTRAGLEPATQESNSCMLPVTPSGNCIADRIRTCILFVPGEVFNQLECCYTCGSYGDQTHCNRSTICYVIITPTNLVSSPLHLTGKLILLPAPDIFTTTHCAQMDWTNLLPILFSY